MDTISLLGYIAAILTTISFIPQVIKILVTKNTKGISLLMYILFSLGVFCWLLYGILLGEYPIIIANTITVLLSSSVLILKIRNKFFK